MLQTNYPVEQILLVLVDIQNDFWTDAYHMPRAQVPPSPPTPFALLFLANSHINLRILHFFSSSASDLALGDFSFSLLPASPLLLFLLLSH